MSFSKICLLAALTCGSAFSAGDNAESILNRSDFRHYIDSFNQSDKELTGATIPNAQAWGWLQQNVPFFECSNKQLEQMYYFRWWTYRKHIRATPAGFVITEFLPDVPWAGKWNTVSASAGPHLYEGRWLRNRKYLDDYATFWFRKGGNPRLYSSWMADALRARALVSGDQQFVKSLFADLVANYAEWEKTHLDSNGLFWQIDDRDGMEMSIGGSGYRPTINSYMFGDAMALSDIAHWAWDDARSIEFRLKADKLREMVETKLWNETQRFYETLPRGDNKPNQLVDVRELIGYVPWYFNLPNPGREVAWGQLLDPQGFAAAFGPTTVERRNPRFMAPDRHECLWDGPSWPYATSQTLTALENLLNNYRQAYVDKADFLKLLEIYTQSQHLKLPDGRDIPFIDEDLNPDDGHWIARTMLHQMPEAQAERIGGKDRGRDYNHSTYNDLIITGLVGLRPRLDHRVEVNPLIPEGALDYFCLDGVRYHGWDLTILYDRSGAHYKRGQGLRIFANGQEIGSSKSLKWTLVNLPQTAAGWRKYIHDPLIGGGKLGTVFDIAVLHEDGKYRMWGSWRPKKSIALFESRDGIHWGDPIIVLPPDMSTGWEADINRPTVVKRADGYHMWYTGQADNQSRLGYATSPDGIKWTRMSKKPILSPDLPWEKTSVMSPDVIWDEAKNQYRMWYSGGEQYEPDAIGYATSPDGLHWTKDAQNPMFGPDPANIWEQNKVAGVQVLHHAGWFYMFYIGYRDVDHAQIGIARSKDGITNWQRLPSNPIIRPGQDQFDEDACYKPYVIFDNHRWMLWYNGRHGTLEQIAMAFHDGEDLGFPN